ncbi:unnamed protein product [Didymodactylos carnosus]|uniref:Uncharacterized protein n=1 Tax=Didymodactylos carnosus TaxID=1234261 RepID=A0A8S2DXI5_9BILA|nr:unnamed protein product [Didymodactylos carnosus]CAF3761915.1 unnamed protein product [Didymodactylos carnosus]
MQDNPIRLNVDDMPMSPSPLNTRPCLFQPSTLFDSETFERVRSAVSSPLDKTTMETEEEVETEDEDGDEQEQGLADVLTQTRATEIERLSQSIVNDRPSHTGEFADVLIQLLDDIPENPIPTMMESDNANTAMATRRSHPPIDQTGFVDDHDRPYADYGHLDGQTIAQECAFDLQPSSNQQPIRLNTKSFAITSWTHVSKDAVLTEIKRRFGIENIQYICIGEEMSELNHQQHVHVQIILKEKVNLKTRFLDSITQTSCNYQVTQNDLAWNEYIKKGGNYLEFNEFKSTKQRGRKQ